MKKRLLSLLVLSCLLFLGVKKANAATTLTETTVTDGTASPIIQGQTGIAMFSFSVTSTGNGTTPKFTQLTFTGVGGNVANYFSNARLYVNTTTNDFSTAGLVTAGGGTGVIAGTTVTFSGLNESIARNDVNYYYLVVDFTGTGTLPTTYQFNMNTTGTGGMVSSAGTTTLNDRTGSLYNLYAGLISQAQTTGGLTANPLNTTQTKVVLSGVALASTGTSSLTGISYTATKNISSYFTGNASLYSSTSSTFLGTTDPSSTLLQTKAIPTGTGALAFTFPTQTISNGITVYYYIVLDNYSPPTISATFEFDVNAITSATSAITYVDKTGSLYNLNAPSLSENQTTGGLAANPLAVTQTNVALSGVALTATGTTSVTGISYTATKNFNPYFTGNATLYSSTSSTFLGITDPSSTLLQSKAVPTGTTALAFTFTAQPISNGVTMYYYVVFDNYNAAAATTTFGLNVNVVTGTTTTYVNKTGTVYNLLAPSISLDQTTGGLTANPLAVTQTNVALSGVALTATGATSITGISYTATKNFNPYFTGNATLYSSTSSTFLGITDPSSTLLQSKAVPTGTTALAFTFTAQPISNGVTMYYYVVFDNYNAAAATTTFGLNVNVVTGTTTTYVNKTGTVYNLLAPSISLDQTTGGLAANPLTVPQTNVALSGVALTATGATSITGISYTATKNFNPYFTGNATLYSSTSSTFLGITDPSSTLLQSKAVPTGTTALAFTFTAQPISNGVTMYYYVVFDNYNVAAATTTFGLNVNVVTGTTTTYVNKIGTVYNLLAPSLAEATITAGLAPTTLTTNQTNIAIFGMSLKATGNASFSTLNFTTTTAPAVNISAYFSSLSLYSSTSSTFLGTTDPSSTLLQTTTSLGVNAFNFTGLTETINDGITKYYYLVVNYNQPSVTGGTFRFNFTGTTGTAVLGTIATAQTYTITPPSLTEVQTTGGLVADPLNSVLTNIPINGIALTSNNGNSSLTAITYKATQNIGTYFTGNVTLYSSTSSTFLGATDPTSTLIGTQAAPATQNITFTFPTQTIASGVTTYYYMVFANYTPPQTTTTFEMDLVSITGSTSILNAKNGTNYNLIAPSFTEDQVTGGLAANPINGVQTKVPLSGISLQATGPARFTQLTYKASQTINAYFTGNVSLYSSTSSTFLGTTDPTSTLIGSQAAPNNTNLVFTVPTQNIATGVTMYYYVVMDNYTPPTATVNFELDLVTVTVGSNTTYNNKLGTNYTLTSAVTFGTASTTGFAVNPLNYSQTGIALLGFSINTIVSKTFSQINLTYALSNGTFTTDFSNFKLYVNTTGNTYAGATQVTGAIFTPGANTLKITGLSQTIPTTTYSYFIVADFNDPATSATVQLSAASAVATATYSYGAPIAGNVYNIGPATNNWVGGSGGNDWNVPANWSYGVVPLPADHVQIGVNVNFAPANSPIISTPVTIASIDAASNNGSTAISLTVNNTLTVNGDITESSDGNSHGSQTLNLNGTGTINATDIVVHDDFSFNFNFNVSVNSSVTTLKVSQNISLTTSAFIFFAESSTFNLTGGTATVGGIFQSANNEISFIPSISTFSVNNAKLILTNAAAISGLDNDNNNVVNFNNAGSTVQYSGVAQIIYTDAAITGLSTGPSYTNLIIAGTGAKTLTPGGNLNIAGDFTNSLTNDASNYVTLTNTNNQVIFNGTITQTLNGGVGTGTLFNNVSFTGNSTKTMSTGTFTVISAGTLSMTGTGATCILNANGLLTLVSDQNSTATVASFTGPKITGNVNVQRYVTGGAPYRGYRLFSSPVNINNLTNQSGTTPATNEGFVDPTYLNGGMLTGGPGTGFRTTNANPLSYLYDDTRASNAFHFYSGKNVGIYSIAGSPNYTVTVYNTDGSVVPTPIKVPVGNAFLVYYAGTTALTNPTPESTVVTATGTLNQGTVNIWLFNTNPATVTRTLTKIGGNAILGLNQVGNPYASTIQLSSFYTDNSASIAPTVYLLDPTTGISGTYLGYNASTKTTSSTNRASNYVVSGQGFWVQAKAGVGTPTIAFLETEKVPYPAITSATTSSGSPSTGGTLLMDIPPTTASNNDVTAGSFAQNTAAVAPATDPVAALVGLHLQLSKDSATSIAYTQTGIYFRSDWTDTFNANDDAIDRDGATPKVFLSSYSSDAQRLCINQLAGYTKGKRIKLYAGATTSGLYYISLADIANIDTINYNVYLVDHKMNDSLDMVKYKAYAFNINNTDTTTFGANRFTLVIERHTLPPYSLLTFSGQKVNNGIQLNWKTLNEGTYTGFALQKLGGSNTYASIYTTQGTGLGLYTYVDTRPLNGNNIYRLQQTDIDGRVTYSQPITIRYNGSLPNGTLTVYPNPAKNIINVSLNTTGPSSSNYIVDIYNISGTIIDHKTVNTNNWTQDVSNYKLGVYVIEIKTSDGYLVGKTKFVKIIN